MPTYPQWEATVLDHTYEAVDHISLHMYFTNYEKHTANYLALNHVLDEYIGTVAGIIDYVKAKKRSKKQVTISFDEWNVWYHTRKQDRAILDGADWPHAPALLEDIYNFEDALQVGCILNTFIRRADVVKIACIAQLVNVIAPIMTEPGGRAWRQTIYYPYYFASIYGRGTALRLAVDCPVYDADVAGGVPYVDIAGVRDEAGTTLTFFAVNRNGEQAVDLALSLEGFGTPRITEHLTIRHPDLEAVNTAGNPDNVVPIAGTGAAVEDGKVHFSLPPYSYHVIRVAVG
jgi:alpha-N-arabinofuranosidase